MNTKLCDDDARTVPCARCRTSRVSRCVRAGMCRLDDARSTTRDRRDVDAIDDSIAIDRHPSRSMSRSIDRDRQSIATWLRSIERSRGGAQWVCACLVTIGLLMSTTHTKGERPPQKKAPPSVGWGNLAEISSVDRDPSGSRAIDVAHRWMTRAIDACAGWTTTTTHACAKRAIDSRACWRGRRRRARRRGRRRAGLRRVSLARVARARTVRDGARA